MTMLSFKKMSAGLFLSATITFADNCERLASSAWVASSISWSWREPENGLLSKDRVDTVYLSPKGKVGWLKADMFRYLKASLDTPGQALTFNSGSGPRFGLYGSYTCKNSIVTIRFTSRWGSGLRGTNYPSSRLVAEWMRERKYRLIVLKTGKMKLIGDKPELRTIGSLMDDEALSVIVPESGEPPIPK